MALRRLDDAELGRRTRERNTRANQVHRERLLNSGKRQTNVWLSAALRERLDAESAATATPLSQIVEQLLGDGLNYRQLAEPPRPTPSVDAKTAPESLPLFEPASTEPAPPLKGGSVKGESVHTDADAFNQDLIAAVTEPPVIASLPARPAALPLFQPVDASPAPESAHPVAKPAAKTAKANHTERDAMIVELQKQGVSYRQIASRLAAQGHLSANGTPLSIGQIGRVLERAGLIKENGE